MKLFRGFTVVAALLGALFAVVLTGPAAQASTVRKTVTFTCSVSAGVVHVDFTYDAHGDPTNGIWATPVKYKFYNANGFDVNRVELDIYYGGQYAVWSAMGGTVDTANDVDNGATSTSFSHGDFYPIASTGTGAYYLAKVGVWDGVGTTKSCNNTQHMPIA